MFYLVEKKIVFLGSKSIKNISKNMYHREREREKARDKSNYRMVLREKIEINFINYLYVLYLSILRSNEKEKEREREFKFDEIN